MEEVALMKLHTMTRSSMPLTAACAPLGAPAAAVSATPIVAAAWAPVPLAHQVRAQAELALTGVYGTNGTTGFMGLGNAIDSKRSVDERGVPPRGKPV